MPLTLPGRIVRPEYTRFRDYEIELAQLGQGQWSAFRALDIDLNELQQIAREWGRQLEHVERPWLCWNVDSDWCLVQQKLVREAGWTPLVGFDPRVGPPARVLPEAVVFDFNGSLCLPLLYPHFPLEFAYLFASKMAFWHSDLLVRRDKIHGLARIFESLADGSTAACRTDPGLRYRYLPWRQRYWELVGCTTRSASRDQFEKGCGWWMAYWAHPHQTRSEAVRRWRYWDHGAGIWHWQKHAGGDVVMLDAATYAEGHFTKIGKKDYVGTREPNGSDVRREMSQELVRNFDLSQACRSLGLGDLVETQSMA